MTGSSPRVRGTSARKGRRQGEGVHPRVCGERSGANTVLASAIGSSPRVRGTFRQAKGLSQDDRFIPACAGNVIVLVHLRIDRTVHPRVCGERTCCQPWLRVLGNRFIPACAGNVGKNPCMLPKIPVHPRVCGERLRHEPFAARRAGSSPRVRGTFEDAGLPEICRRFIPACAGNVQVPRR